MAKYKLPNYITAGAGAGTGKAGKATNKKATGVLGAKGSAKRVSNKKNSEATETHYGTSAGGGIKSGLATGKGTAGRGGGKVNKEAVNKALAGKTAIGIGPRINFASYDFFTKTFGNLNSGTKYILDVFPALYNLTLREMKGIFTEEELRMMLEVVNSNEFSIPGMGFPGKFLLKTVVHHLEEGNQYFNWKVDIKTITDEFDRLTNFQAFAFIIWCQPGVDLFGDEEDEENEELRKIVEEKIKMLLEVKD